MAIAGMTTDAPTESVAVSGNTASQAFEGMFDPERLAAQREGFGERGGPAGAEEGTRGGTGGRFGGVPGAGRGGLGGGGGQRGGGPRGAGLRGGANPFFIGDGRGQFPNRPNINLNYSLGNSAFDASPYSLKGPSTSKPDYGQSRFGVTVGGPLKIPKLFDLGNRNFFTITYNASRTHNPFDAFSTVPTAVERAGDFSETYFRGGKPVLIADPVTGVPFQNNRIPAPSINPAAARLMSFIPLPNLPGNVQNYHYVTTNKDNSNDLNVRFNHSFGASGSPRGRGPRSGFGGGGRGGARRSAFNIGQKTARSTTLFRASAGPRLWSVSMFQLVIPIPSAVLATAFNSASAAIETRQRICMPASAMLRAKPGLAAFRRILLIGAFRSFHLRITAA